MLKVDFYESGIGDTIVVTFPDNGIGIIDAHPGSDGRPPLATLVAGREIHFLCLTHPHQDHGLDLVEVAETHPQIGSFWHTVADHQCFFYSVAEIEKFPSSVRDYARRQREDYAACFIKLFSAVFNRGIPRHVLRADLQPFEIAGVEVHVFGPEEKIQNKYFDAMRIRLERDRAELPDENLLSAIIALKYGPVVLLFGGDALKPNWAAAAERYFRAKIPWAVIVKVPHHGASNAFNFTSRSHSYLDLCRQPDGVLFAGDSKHPADKVFEVLKQKSNLRCLSNGKVGGGKSNPLNIEIDGAWSPKGVKTCNPHIGYEIYPDGDIVLTAGEQCAACCA